MSLFLGLDDVYMFHERIVPKLFHASELVVIGFEALWLMTFIVVYKRKILETRWLTFALAIAVMAFSVLFDSLAIVFKSELIVEDTAKLIGIVLWCYYFSDTAYAALRKDAK